MFGLLAVVDPDGGATVQAIDALKAFVTGSLAGAFFALVVAGLGIAMGVKWLKKANNAAGAGSGRLASWNRSRRQ